MMSPRRSLKRLLYAYAGFLIAAGVAGYMVVPHHAGTAVVLGAMGGVGILWLARQAEAKAQWAGSGATTMVGVFTLTFVWRALYAWKKVYNGDESMTAVAVLLSLMFGVSLTVLLRVLRDGRSVV